LTTIKNINKPAAVADEVSLPFDQISLEMIYRSLYHFYLAHQRRLHQWLYQQLCGCGTPSPQLRRNQPVRHLSGGNLQPLLQFPLPREGKKPDYYGHPVDFHINEGLLNVWGGCTLGSKAVDIDLIVDTLGNIPGDFLNLEFLMLKHFELGVQKYIDILENIDCESKLINFLRMEKLIFDSPDQAGEAYRQLTKDFYQGNKLIQGQVEIGNKRVDVGNIRIPILNIYAEQYPLVPPASSLALKTYIASEDYTLRSFPVGHIGMYLSSKVQRNLPPTIVHWLKVRS
jgi:hypothetical protein